MSWCCRMPPPWKRPEGRDRDRGRKHEDNLAPLCSRAWSFFSTAPICTPYALRPASPSLLPSLLLAHTTPASTPRALSILLLSLTPWTMPSSILSYLKPANPQVWTTGHWLQYSLGSLIEMQILTTTITFPFALPTAGGIQVLSPKSGTCCIRRTLTLGHGVIMVCVPGFCLLLCVIGQAV